MPMTGQPILAARSITLHIFSLMTSPSEPPKTVKSWREDAHAAAVDRAVAGHDRVAPGARLVHLELVRAVAHVGVELLEGARVEQLLDPLAGRVLALRVLLLHRLLGGVVDRGVAQLLQPGELLFVRLEGFLAHGPRSLCAGQRRRGRTLSVTGGREPSESRTSTRSSWRFGLRLRLSLRPTRSAPFDSVALERARALGQRDAQLAVARELDRAARQLRRRRPSPARRGARAWASPAARRAAAAAPRAAPARRSAAATDSRTVGLPVRRRVIFAATAGGGVQPTTVIGLLSENCAPECAANAALTDRRRRGAEVRAEHERAARCRRPGRAGTRRAARRAAR